MGITEFFEIRKKSLVCCLIHASIQNCAIVRFVYYNQEEYEGAGSIGRKLGEGAC